MSHITGATTMKKLIDRYRANPTTENADRILTHIRKHPFATLLLDSEDLELIETLHPEN
jgi:hypothetical protein